MSQQLPSRTGGVGRVLVVVYAILAIAATGRSVYQIATKFDEAPVAYALSAVAALVYVVATIGLALGRRGAPVAWAAVSFELVGVLAVGVLSLTHPELFAHPSVWSTFGMGYLFIPLVLPFLGIWWLLSRRRAALPTPATAV